MPATRRESIAVSSFSRHQNLLMKSTIFNSLDGVRAGVGSSFVHGVHIKFVKINNDLQRVLMF